MTKLLLVIAVGLYFSYLFYFYWKVVAGGIPFISAPTWFLIINGLLALGTLLAVDVERPDDLRWLGIVILGITSFIAGAYIANIRYRFVPAEEIRSFKEKPTTPDLSSGQFFWLIIGMGVVSAIIGLLFALAVGYNVLLESIRMLIQGSNAETIRVQYSLMRTGTSYAGEKYVAPGYARQFFATLLPTVLFIVYFQKFRIEKHRTLGNYFLIILFGTITAYLLTLTGSRGLVIEPIMLFLFLGTSLGPFSDREKIPRRTTFFWLGLIMIFYITVSAIMGRTGSVGVGTSAVDFWNRMVSEKAIVQMQIMYYLFQKPVVWGSNWYDIFLNVLPEHSTGFSNELYRLIRGSTRGSIGLNFFGSAWYNWSTVGVFIIAMALGGMSQYFTIRYFRGKKELTRVIILFIAGYYLGNFRDPQTLLLNGFITMLLYYGIIILGKKLLSENTNQTKEFGLSPEVTD